MSNTWIAVPVWDNSVDLTEFVGKFTGEYVAPEKYTKQEFNVEKREMEDKELDHPYSGQTAPNFNNKLIFINTSPGYTVYPGVVHIEDFADFNVYRGWNTAIDHAASNGADSVLLMNGVMDLDPFVAKEAIDAFDSQGKEIINLADGALLIISTTSSVKPDDQFQIWFGDNDLYRRAEGNLGHYRSELFKMDYLINHNMDETFKSIVASDEAKYNTKWS